MTTPSKPDAATPPRPSWQVYDFEKEEPACVRCGRSMSLKPMCDWSDVDSANVCSDCAIIVAEECSDLDVRHAQLTTDLETARAELVNLNADRMALSVMHKAEMRENCELTADLAACRKALEASLKAMDAMNAFLENVNKRNPGWVGKLFGINFELMNDAFIQTEKAPIAARAALARGKETA